MNLGDFSFDTGLEMSLFYRTISIDSTVNGGKGELENRDHVN